MLRFNVVSTRCKPLDLESAFLAGNGKERLRQDISVSDHPVMNITPERNPDFGCLKLVCVFHTLQNNPYKCR